MNNLIWLIVIVLLVYLASQTLMKGEKQEKVTYSELQTAVASNPGQFESIVANPSKQQLTVEYQPSGGNVIAGHHTASAATASRACPGRPSRRTAAAAPKRSAAPQSGSSSRLLKRTPTACNLIHVPGAAYVVGNIPEAKRKLLRSRRLL